MGRSQGAWERRKGGRRKGRGEWGLAGEEEGSREECGGREGVSGNAVGGGSLLRQSQRSDQNLKAIQGKKIH